MLYPAITLSNLVHYFMNLCVQLLSNIQFSSTSTRLCRTYLTIIYYILIRSAFCLLVSFPILILLLSSFVKLTITVFVRGYLSNIYVNNLCLKVLVHFRFELIFQIPNGNLHYLYATPNLRIKKISFY